MLYVVHEKVPLRVKKCEIDVFEGLASTVDPLQTLNSLRIAGVWRPVKPTER